MFCISFLFFFLHFFFCLCFFFFSSRRRHTRLVSDWSSDVWSSDLSAPPLQQRRRCSPAAVVRSTRLRVTMRCEASALRPRSRSSSHLCRYSPRLHERRPRSEERRVGKECRSRVARDDERKRR